MLLVCVPVNGAQLAKVLRFEDLVCTALFFGFDLGWAAYTVEQRAGSQIAKVDDKLGQEEDDDVDEAFRKQENETKKKNDVFSSG